MKHPPLHLLTCRSMIFHLSSFNALNLSFAAFACRNLGEEERGDEGGRT